MANGEKVVETPPKKQTNYVQGVPVLNYHFFYDENNSEDAAGCREVICHTKKQFKTHLDYFKEKNMIKYKCKKNTRGNRNRYIK